jgi:hypothetical protein
VITFDCRDEVLFDDSDTSGDEADAKVDVPVEDRDDDVSDRYAINFTVRIKKSSGRELVLRCVAEDGLTVLSSRVESFPDNTQQISGPVIESLADELQDAFVGFLEERLVDRDLTAFIVQYAADKEQREYMHWLKSLLEFSEDPH